MKTITHKEMDEILKTYEDVLPSSMFRDGMLFINKEKLADVLDTVSRFFPTEEGYGDDPYASLHPCAIALKTLAEQIFTGRIKITNLQECLENQIKRLEGKILYVEESNGYNTETSVVVDGKFEYKMYKYSKDVESFDLNNEAAYVQITELKDDTVVRITSNIKNVFTLHTNKDKIKEKHDKKVGRLIGRRVFHYDNYNDVVHCATVTTDGKIRLYMDDTLHSFDLYNLRTEIDITYDDTYITAVDEDGYSYFFHTNIQSAI